MEQKQAAIFNDLSGFGRCSISVILPILSAMGHQGVAIPTAVLSMHTEFPHYHMIDLSDQLPAYLESYRKEGLRFDALCTGFLSNPTQAQIVRSCLRLLKEDALVLIDPVLGDGGRNNTRRVVHAVEISLEAGVPYSSLRTGRHADRPFRTIKFAIERSRDELFGRINARVGRMIADGLEQEARRAFARGHFNSLNTVGYKEMAAYFDGTMDFDTAVARIAKNTRVYAKKQLTWMNRDPEIIRLAPDEALAASIAAIDSLLICNL